MLVGRAREEKARMEKEFEAQLEGNQGEMHFERKRLEERMAELQAKVEQMENDAALARAHMEKVRPHPTPPSGDWFRRRR